MFSLQRKLRIRESPSSKGAQVFRAELSELSQQIGKRFSFALLELSEAIERREATAILGKNYLRAGNPVRALPVIEMTNDHVRTPGVWTFVAVDPVIRQSRKHCAQCRWRTLENRDSIVQVEIHLSHDFFISGSS